MKFQFEANQKFQLDAIQSVVDLFEGHANFMRVGNEQFFPNYELGFGNNLFLDNEHIQKNLRQVQVRNGIYTKDSIQTRGLNFSIEMETGTGKTYVYLRSIFELNKQYGFRKFIIVVPSVAIREGVLQSINMMKAHFQGLYNYIPFTHFVYDAKKLNCLTSFGTGNDLQIMIMNIDSFNKKSSNIIHFDSHEKTRGKKPIEFIQMTRPILILDEPQNMESQVGSDALNSLNPLCTLRYSATHRDKYNLVYQLDPVKAFQMRLVKKISVASVLSNDNLNQSYIRLESVSCKNNLFRAKLKFFRMTKSGPVLTAGVFKQGESLLVRSYQNNIYRHGFHIVEISTKPGAEQVRFANGVCLALGDELGGNKEYVIKKQILETVKAHFEKELQVVGKGIKVLSLFFLDRVENYRVYKDSSYNLGKYAKWFEEIYNELAEKYRNALTDIIPVEKVHNGYFSKDKQGNFKNSTTGSNQDDGDTYTLIMRDKEKLLDLQNPLKFIFTHSALREGWDNPNVFQICTLNETVSPLKKRQEIGRGLRLPVDQRGCRVFDESVNTLLVVANESYQHFVSALQYELEEDCGVSFGRLPMDAFVGIKITQGNAVTEIEYEQSKALWTYLKSSNWIASDGSILEAFTKALEDHSFVLPEVFRPATREIINVIAQHQMDEYICKYEPGKRTSTTKTCVDPDFEKFWNDVTLNTIYSVRYETKALIQQAASLIGKIEAIAPPVLKTTFTDLSVEPNGVFAEHYRIPASDETITGLPLPDILTYIQHKVGLTRSTICQILVQSGRLDDFIVNPQSFMDSVVKAIRKALQNFLVGGLCYEKLNQASYKMSLFRQDEYSLAFRGEQIIKMEKTFRDYIGYNLAVEPQPIKKLDSIPDSKYFIKLPTGFCIATPIGDYCPDWAILMRNGGVVYMIQDTRATKDRLQLQFPEIVQMAYGQQHFESMAISDDIENT